MTSRDDLLLNQFLLLILLLAMALVDRLLVMVGKSLVRTISDAYGNRKSADRALESSGEFGRVCQAYVDPIPS